MFNLINFLILLFLLLIIYQLFLAYFGKSCFKEGLENQYKDYDTNNPANALILAQQNAGNIMVLKGQLDNLLGVNKQVQDLSGNVTILQTQVIGLVQAQKDYATKMVGTTPPQITGT